MMDAWQAGKIEKREQSDGHRSSCFVLVLQALVYIRAAKKVKIETRSQIESLLLETVSLYASLTSSGHTGSCIFKLEHGLAASFSLSKQGRSRPTLGPDQHGGGLWHS